MQETRLLEIVLPKWPQMLVTGKSVTVEQAKDIIFRTDTFFTDASVHSGGNCRAFNAEYRNKAGLTALQVFRNNPGGHSWVDVDWDRRDYLCRRLGVVRTRYVRNEWGSCSFVGGPHGWCHPDGTIAFTNNVGKWPSVVELLDDWADIAQAFPYLDLHVSLMSGESSMRDTVPLVNIRVVNGQATVESPDLTVHSEQVLADPDTELEQAKWIALIRDSSNELGLAEDWYDEFAARVRCHITKL